MDDIPVKQGGARVEDTVSWARLRTSDIGGEATLTVSRATAGEVWLIVEIDGPGAETEGSGFATLEPETARTVARQLTQAADAIEAARTEDATPGGEEA